MFKSRPAGRVHAVATFFWTHDKCSVLLLVIQTKLLIQFDWIGSLSAGKGGLIDFVLFCNVVSSRGSRIAQCSTGIKSGIGLEQHQTEPDQTRSGRNSCFFLYVYIYSVFTVCIYSGELTCSRLCDSPPGTQGRAFHLFITTRCQLHLTPTLSYKVYIQYMYLYMKHAWRLHNKARVEWKFRSFLLVSSEKQWFQGLDICRIYLKAVFSQPFMNSMRLQMNFKETKKQVKWFPTFFTDD